VHHVGFTVLICFLFFDEGNWGKDWMVSVSFAADESLLKKVGFAALLRNLQTRACCWPAYIMLLLVD
jgi:hypothetical protein